MRKLFDTGPINVLPRDGHVTYHGAVMTTSEADKLFDSLMASIAWKHDEAKLFGKHYVTKRMAAWYADKAYEYTYSNITKRALIWTRELEEIKKFVEEKSEATYNSCLLNLYHDGSESMAWHSDGEKTLKKNATIASVSLGAERKFAFKHKASNEVISLNLEHGSLLLMGAGSQQNWLHRLPPTKKVMTPRINLTFRTIIEK